MKMDKIMLDNKDVIDAKTLVQNIEDHGLEIQSAIWSSSSYPIRWTLVIAKVLKEKRSNREIYELIQTELKKGKYNFDLDNISVKMPTDVSNYARNDHVCFVKTSLNINSTKDV